jgi:hypothetical protein
MTARQGSGADVSKSRATVELLEALKKQCRRARRANLGAEHGVKQMRFGPRTRCLRPRRIQSSGGSLGQVGWCRGPESNWLRRPFQGRALPVSYLGTGTAFNSTEIAAK